MNTKLPLKSNKIILALGAESAGNFSVYQDEKIYFSEDFGDLLDEKNWKNYQKAVLKYLNNHQLKSNVILTDLHPLYKTTLWGKELSKKYKAKHIQTQHHIAHVFSAIGDRIILDAKYKIPNTLYGVACDGTGYGTDGKIWGGEIFEFQSSKFKIKSYKRVGYLENQMLIGGDLAIKEPVRMLIGILNKFLEKKEIYNFVKKYYTKNEFELLYNQLQQNFNCQETSSTGRVLDAVSLLLGFCGNNRNYKHEPIDLLEKNSSRPYTDLKPNVIQTKDIVTGCPSYILDTTYLFNYVINYLHKDKKRLAATAQLYIAEGLYEILQNIESHEHPSSISFFAGGLANNKIISTFLESKNIYTNKKIPRGDAGLSFGQVVYYLLSK